MPIKTPTRISIRDPSKNSHSVIGEIVFAILKPTFGSPRPEVDFEIYLTANQKFSEIFRDLYRPACENPDYHARRICFAQLTNSDQELAFLTQHHHLKAQTITSLLWNQISMKSTNNCLTLSPFAQFQVFCCSLCRSGFISEYFFANICLKLNQLKQRHPNLELLDLEGALTSYQTATCLPYPTLFFKPHPSNYRPDISERAQQKFEQYSKQITRATSKIQPSVPKPMAIQRILNDLRSEQAPASKRPRC